MGRRQSGLTVLAGAVLCAMMTPFAGHTQVEPPTAPTSPRHPLSEGKPVGSLKIERREPVVPGTEAPRRLVGPNETRSRTPARRERLQANPIPQPPGPNPPVRLIKPRPRSTVPIGIIDPRPGTTPKHPGTIEAR